MTLVRRTRYPQYMSLRDAIDRMFEDAMLPAVSNGNSNGNGNVATVPFDVVEREEEIVVRAPVPGFKSDDIDVTIQGDVLTVTGHFQDERKQDDQDGSYHLREWRSGSFRRSMALPEQVDPDGADAQVEDGVLTLTLPKSESVKPRKISVRTS